MRNVHTFISLVSGLFWFHSEFNNRNILFQQLFTAKSKSSRPRSIHLFFKSMVLFYMKRILFSSIRCTSCPKLLELFPEKKARIWRRSDWSRFLVNLDGIFRFADRTFFPRYFSTFLIPSEPPKNLQRIFSSFCFTSTFLIKVNMKTENWSHGFVPGGTVSQCNFESEMKYLLLEINNALRNVLNWKHTIASRRPSWLKL